MEKKIWHQHYPEGVNTEIDPEAYSSLIDFTEQKLKKYSSNTAFINMDKAISYAELDKLSANFAAYLQNHAGLKKGDVISLLNGKQITNIESLVNGLTPFKAGDTVEISYIRGDVEKTIDVLLSPRSPKSEKRFKWKSVEKDN